MTPDDTVEALVHRYTKIIEEELRALKRLSGPERAERFKTIVTAAECGILFSR